MNVPIISQTAPSMSQTSTFLQKSQEFFTHIVKWINPILRDKKVSFIILLATEVAFFKLIEKICKVIDNKIDHYQDKISSNTAVKISLSLRVGLVVVYISGCVILSKYWPHSFNKATLVAISLLAFVLGITPFSLEKSN